jgi:hypothetical protein
MTIGGLCRNHSVRRGFAMSGFEVQCLRFARWLGVSPSFIVDPEHFLRCWYERHMLDAQTSLGMCSIVFFYLL